MKSFSLGLFWTLFIICLVLSMYFIYNIFINIQEPYVSASFDYDYEDVSGSINRMVTDISNNVKSISDDLNVIDSLFQIDLKL